MSNCKILDGEPTDRVLSFIENQSTDEIPDPQISTVNGISLTFFWATAERILTPPQLEIFRRVGLQGEKEWRIASERGTTIAAVSKIFIKAKKKLEKEVFR